MKISMRSGIALAAAASVSLSWAAVSAQEVQQLTVTPTMEQRAASFDQADVNKDGVLTQEEFLTTPRALPPADPVKALAASDLDKDGKVSKAEFLDPNFGAALAKLLAPPKP
jgi:hypothetical protein